ncbi:MAG: chuR [Chloroflexi bacterium]|jgi:uncharacterized protein|nr:chuR [Chloroflexota bacterium]
MAASAIPFSEPPSFHVPARLTGATCNLDCTYCFFVSKELPCPVRRLRMPGDLLDSYIHQIIESQCCPDITIISQGGELTLTGLDVFCRAVEHAKKN